jgi:hypothetical protein
MKQNGTNSPKTDENQEPKTGELNKPNLIMTTQK